MLRPALFSFIFLSLLMTSCGDNTPDNPLVIQSNDHIAFIGGNLCSRMINFNHFETAIQMRFPEDRLVIRNMCDGGDTPGFRAHSARNDNWAFPGAETFQTELSNPSENDGHFEYPDEWLTRLKTDVIVAFFGYSESFEGEEGLSSFKQELDAFVDHTLSQQYNGIGTPRLALVSPIAFENKSNHADLPNAVKENKNLALYTQAIEEVAEMYEIPFVDVFHPSQKWYGDRNEWTTDGFQLTSHGYKHLAQLLIQKLFGSKASGHANQQLIESAVTEKNWMWHNDYKSPNGVHVFGRRYDPFGPDNYPYELKKLREMTNIRDKAIWAAQEGKKTSYTTEDQSTTTLPKVETNFNPGDYGRGDVKYLYGNDAVKTLHVPDGYKIELFASEEDFEELANPVQLSFDNKGRLWVATMPSYPHYKPGDAKPNDKLIILEDTDGDGRADKRTIAADGLHLPIGFELAPEGVFISQGTNLKLLIDENGDDYYEKEEILLSGFDDHDTHHAISAFTADPSGAIYMAEGVFLHTNVETAYGTVRAHNGGFYRYDPARRHLERTAQLAIPNPWGIAFDDWGQPFFLETSGPAMRWMTPGSIKPFFGSFNHKSKDLILEENKVRPTSGLEFVSSRHFPDDVQGDFVLNNSIGFLGTRQHKLIEDSTGYRTEMRHDLIKGDDNNFRPVDMEFAPDGSLYVVDWHNVLIGHMQHNARDPHRDHVHGRIYRMTYPSRPLVEPAKIADASISQLLDNLKLHEYRSRYRTKRELRGRNQQSVLSDLQKWVSNLDETDPKHEQYLLEALWVSWGMNNVDQSLLKQLLSAKDHRVRAAATKILRYTGHQVSDQVELLTKAAGDEHSRVRLEAIVAASWLDKGTAELVLAEAHKHHMDSWIQPVYNNILSHFNEEVYRENKTVLPNHLEGPSFGLFKKGKEIYEREGFCGTCHQLGGKGIFATGYPPLSKTKWVNGSEERLIKLTLKGLYGPISVKGKDYANTVPMTAYEGLLDDEEVAAVLTYIRNTFGNKSSVIQPETVKKVRAEKADKKGFYNPQDLLEEHPHDN